jgi:two-component system, chemotaxis family, chemotaxis protein CheY
MDKIKILLADSFTPTRILLADTLETLGFEGVAVATNGREALEKFTRYHPDITLIDLYLDGTGGISGIGVVRVLIKNYPSAAVALLMPENLDDPDVIVGAVRAGAKAYIKKSASGEEMKRQLAKMTGRREE